MRRVLVLSSHLDDAILSAGQFVAGRNGNVDVLTVFSGIPMADGLITDYDKSCGFKTSKDAMVIRRQEDIEACAILNARPIHTDVLDSQYTRKQAGIVKLLKKSVKAYDYELIVGPLGLKHPDHLALSNALLSLDLTNLYLYEDLPHRVTHPEAVIKRLNDLGIDLLMEAGGEPDEPVFIGDGPIADKVRAIWCYKSQMNRGDLNPYNLYVGERFWKV